MSKLREKLAGLRDDIGQEKFEAAQNGYGQIHTMTLFLLNQDLPYYSQVEGMAGQPMQQVKQQFIDLFKQVNDKYASDEDVATWSPDKIRQLELNVNKCKNFYSLINYITNSGLKRVSLNQNGIIQIAKTLEKIASQKESWE